MNSSTFGFVASLIAHGVPKVVTVNIPLAQLLSNDAFTWTPDRARPNFELDIKIEIDRQVDLVDFNHTHQKEV